MDLYELLNELNIKYQEVSHPAVYTIDEAEQLHIDLPGSEVKNLFIKDKNNYYLLCVPAGKRADFKKLRETIGSSTLKFANEKELYEKLGLTPGSVTPLGLINNAEHDVILLMDKELKGETVWVHPNVNTKTMSLEMDDLLRFVGHFHTKVIFV